VVRRRGAARVLELLPWGVVLARRFGRRGIQGRTIKPITMLRADAVLELDELRTAIARRRCLVPATGFYDWIRVAPRDQPVYRHLADHAVVGFAGLWFDERSGATTATRFAILGEGGAAVDTGAPVVVPAELHAAWLDPAVAGADAVAALVAAPPPVWITTPVSRRFTDAAVDDAACIKPLPDPAAQLALF
jgi:putative SOS response-associated peptidase YedK